VNATDFWQIAVSLLSQ